ncbi:hypothetical protein F7P73_15660 [Acinetobacter bohemicus]|uniref:Phage tail protein n=1 Tax=Acinetobacter bohemicus TaxID=1435036 RepID=A0A1I6W047_9GAMM|nr:hypothetical protein [Acinetobacter bohemicus]KAB0650723.1 hypothetical protein F7P73_15660 [Acinetobacter bohemicus]SFT19367.1 hypothetical protein SAMN05444586_10375 [Acinetobacter bohemicus]
MSDYTPPDASNVMLNFTKESIPIDSHNVILNFGADDGFNYANISIDTAFKFSATGTVEPPIDIHGTANIVVDTSFLFSSVGTFDINHIVGVSLSCISSFQKAFTCLSVVEIPWAKPIFKAHNSAFYFERSLSLSNHASVGFDKANTLHRAVQIIHEQTTGLSRSAYLKWQENEKLFISRSLVFDESKKLRINRNTDWVELVRKRKTFTYSHQVAHVFEKRLIFEWDKGLELITSSDIAWDKAKAIHYRKHEIQPWPQPELPEYTGSTDLNFVCLCHDVDSHNVILNFGADECIPSIPNRNGWYILNSLSVNRLDNGEKINVLDGNYSTDRSRWCWSYSLTVPASEIAKLEPIAGQPVILRIMVNGFEHHMMLENRSRSRRFAQETYSLSGRSQTALLDAPYAPTRSFLQENERTARQLCQAELDRVNSSIQLNWQLIDELSWILPMNSLSYSNLTPIAAIKLIVESAGGFIYSEKNSNTLTIKPKYKKTFWDSITIADYDRLIPMSMTKDQSTDYELYPDYNGITLSNDQTGLTGQVKRTGTSADILLETVNNSLFTVESMGAYGKAQLAKAGMVETHSLVMPIGLDVGECAPGELTAFNAEWWGISDGVSVSFTHAVVNQTVKVERVNRDE